MRRLYNILFSHRHDDRKWYHVIGWWELRRIAFNAIILLSGLISLACFHFVVVGAGDFIHPMTPILFGFMANFFYTSGWVVELLLRLFGRLNTDKIAIRLFKIGLTLNLNTYTFEVTSVAASRASDRFRLLFRQAGVVPVTFESIKAMQQPYNKTLVEWKVGNESGIAMCEVQKSTDGRSFSTAATVAARNNNSAYNWLDKDLNHQDAVFYRVKAIGGDGVFIYSAIVKQWLKEGSDGITVYPNPVQGAIANLVFSNQPQGLYNIRLIGTSGQEIYKTVVQHTGGNALHKIKLPKTTTGNIAQLLIESSATGNQTKPRR